MRVLSLRASSAAGVNVHALTRDVDTVEEQIMQVTGDKESLTTISKESLVAAVNELNTKKEEILTHTGNVDELSTNDKTSLVKAINELNDNLVKFMDLLNSHVEEISELSEE